MIDAALMRMNQRVDELALELDRRRGEGPRATAYWCHAVSSGTQSLTDSTFTRVNLGGTDIADADGLHDPATNNMRLTIPTGGGGAWLLHGHVAFAAGTSGTRLLYWEKNGSIVLGGQNSIVTASVVEFDTFTIAQLADGDYVSIVAYQVSGASMNIGGSDVNRARAFRIGS